MIWKGNEKYVQSDSVGPESQCEQIFQMVIEWSYQIIWIGDGFIKYIQRSDSGILLTIGWQSQS